jgi:hypothetical protein
MTFGENKRVCCFCGREFMGMGNNPAPVMTEKTRVAHLLDFATNQILSAI